MIRALAIHMFLLLGLAACGTDTPSADSDGATGSGDNTATSDCEPSFPSAVETDGSVLHVSALCPVAEPDGSAGAPYATISEAIEAALPGATILVESGIYEEHLLIEKEGLSIIGALRDEGVDDGGITLRPDDSNSGVLVNGVSGVLLRSVHLEAPTVAGIWITGGGATIEDSSVRDTAADAFGDYGFGVLATEVLAFEMRRTRVTRSAVSGVLVQGAEQAVTITDSTVSQNGRGGIVLEHLDAGAVIRGNTAAENLQAGIAVYSSVGVVLEGNDVSDTRAEPSEGGHGIVVGEAADAEGLSLGPSEVTIGGEAADGALGNTVTGSDSVGLLLTGAVTALVVGNELSGNERGGVLIWGVDGAAPGGIVLQQNTLQANHFIGVAVCAGRHAELSENLVTGTLLSVPEGAMPVVGPDLASLTMGDGVGVYTESSAVISGNTISQNARAGVIFDGFDSAQTTLSGNTYEGNALGDIVAQNTTAFEDGMAADTEDVTTLGDMEERLHVYCAADQFGNWW